MSEAPPGNPPETPSPTPPGSPPSPGSTPPAPSPGGSWLDSLPDDLKTSPSLGRYKEIPALARGYVELEKKIGAGGVRVPKDDAPQTEWDKFYRDLGRPGAPEEYQLQPPEGVPFDEDAEKRLRMQAYKLGLTPKQTQGLVNAYADDVKESINGRKEAMTEAEEFLKEKYKSNFPRNIAISQRALKAMDSDGSLKTFLDETGLGNHPAIIEMFLTLGKQMVEDGSIPGDVDGIATREAALEKVRAIEADKTHPYHKSKFGDPVHTEVTKLYQLAYDG